MADLVTPAKMATPGSSMRYRSQINFYDKGVKQLALNVFGTLRKEGGRNASMNSLIKRTAAFTNVSERALYKWVAKHDKHSEAPGNRAIISYRTRAALRMPIGMRIRNLMKLGAFIFNWASAALSTET